MCELFGITAAKRIQVNQYLAEMFSHSVDHPHGWGVATFYGDAVSLEKEPLSAWISSYLQSRLKASVEAENLIAHIRLATVGNVAYENCHPFVKRDSSGRAWTLAHNGTIFRQDEIAAYSKEQEGNTDSERLLCHIIHVSDERYEHRGKKLSALERFQMIDDIVVKIARDNKLNLLMYDGEMMYVHTNMRNTLYYCETEDSVMFSTVPLMQGQWKPLPFMQLLAFQNGKLQYQGSKHNYEYIMADSSPAYDYASL